MIAIITQAAGVAGVFLAAWFWMPAEPPRTILRWATAQSALIAFLTWWGGPLDAALGLPLLALWLRAYRIAARREASEASESPNSGQSSPVDETATLRQATSLVANEEGTQA